MCQCHLFAQGKTGISSKSSTKQQHPSLEDEDVVAKDDDLVPALLVQADQKLAGLQPPRRPAVFAQRRATGGTGSDRHGPSRSGEESAFESGRGRKHHGKPVVANRFFPVVRYMVRLQIYVL